MKKLILPILLTAVSLTCAAQTKPQYKKVVVIPIEDYQTLVGALNQSKSALIYQPGITADQKVQTQQQIDAYLQELPKRVRLDSVKVEEKQKKP